MIPTSSLSSPNHTSSASGDLSILELCRLPFTPRLLSLARGHGQQSLLPPHFLSYPHALLKASILLRHLFFALGISNYFSYHSS